MAELTPEKAREIRDRIRGNFDRGAADYARFESEGAFFRRLFGELLAGAPPLLGKRVLDVGCGTGASLEGLLEAVGPEGRVCGIDVSQGMLREAGRRLGDRVSLALMDGCRYGGALRARFDAVVYNAVLFMLPDARASLEAARQVLEPGGMVLISSLEGAFLSPEGRPLPEVLAGRGLAVGRHALSPWPLVSSLVEGLFEVPVVRRLSLRLSPKEFLAFYGMEPMSAGLLPSLPFPERRRILSELSGEWERGEQFVKQAWNLAQARRPLS